MPPLWVAFFLVNGLGILCQAKHSLSSVFIDVIPLFQDDCYTGRMIVAVRVAYCCAEH